MSSHVKISFLIIFFVPLTTLKFVGVLYIFGSSLEVFINLGNLWLSSAIFIKCLEMFKKCLEKFVWPLHRIWKIFRNLHKVVGNHQQH